MPMIHVNRADFYYEVWGKGHPLILIAGYTCDHLFWVPILEQLSQKFQVVVFDNRGIGQTKDQGGPLSVELMADDVMALSQALGLKRPHILGQSMGGTIAQQIGYRYSDQIGKLMIMNSTAKWRLAVLFALEALLKMRKAGVDFEIVFQMFLAWIFGESFLQDQNSVQAFKQFFLENLHPQSIENQERQFAVLKQFDGRKQLAAIKAPTLVIRSKQDLTVLADEAEWMAAEIPHAKLTVCDCGHGCVAEIPDQAVELLIRFLM
jgi:3-oxoadipate enol-lactonase